MPITLLDGILVGFTLVSAMLAMVRGFSREVLSVVSWAAAAAAAFFFYKPVLPYVQPYVDNDKIAMAAAAGHRLRHRADRRFRHHHEDSPTGSSIPGSARSTARSASSTARRAASWWSRWRLLFFNWLAGAKAPAWVANAKSRPLLEQIGAKLESLLPDDPENAILKKLNPNQPAAPEAGTEAPAAPTTEAPATGDDADAPAPDDSGSDAPADNAPAQPANPAPAAPAN